VNGTEKYPEGSVFGFVIFRVCSDFHQNQRFWKIRDSSPICSTNKNWRLHRVKDV